MLFRERNGEQRRDVAHAGADEQAADALVIQCVGGIFGLDDGAEGRPSIMHEVVETRT